MGADAYWAVPGTEDACIKCKGTARQKCGWCKGTGAQGCDECHGTGVYELHNGLPHQLTCVLRNKFGINCADIAMLNQSHIPWVEGLRDAGVEGAQELIDALVEHGEVEIGCDC